MLYCVFNTECPLSEVPLSCTGRVHVHVHVCVMVSQRCQGPSTLLLHLDPQSQRHQIDGPFILNKYTPQIIALIACHWPLHKCNIICMYFSEIPQTQKNLVANFENIAMIGAH